MSMRRVLSSVLLVGSLHLVGCAVDGADEPLTGEAARDPAASPTTAEELASAAEEPACDATRFDYALTGDAEADADARDEAISIMREGDDAIQSAGERAEVQGCGTDLYFHPNNGSHGGWINSWRLCYEGWDTATNSGKYRICTGGTAPVRYWNPQSCGGNVHNYYPQGWGGRARTGGGCCVL